MLTTSGGNGIQNLYSGKLEENMACGDVNLVVVGVLDIIGHVCCG